MNGHSDILIIGGGIGGMTAALYAARANLSVRIVEKEVCGGLVNWTHTVENVPSYKSIHGMDLMTACREHVESLGVAIEEVNEVEEVRLDGQPKEIRTSEGDSFTADVVIIATGRKPIPLPVETAFEKVHYCSVCDGTAYKDKDVLVVGGGNSAFDEGLYLLNLGVAELTVVEIMDRFFAAEATQDALLDLQNQLDEAQTTIDALESSAEETDAALAEAQRENQALLALYTIQQQYSAGDLAGCQASIDAFEASEYRDALPETAEEGVTPPSQRYAQLKEAAEAR